METILREIDGAKSKIRDARALANGGHTDFDDADLVLEGAAAATREAARLIGAACLAVIELRKKWSSDPKVRHRLDSAFTKLRDAEAYLGRLEF